VESLEDRVVPIVSGPTTTTLQAVPDPAPTGHMITLTADVSSVGGYSPGGGSVAFFDGGTPLGTVPLTVPPGLGPGTAQFTVPSLPAGSHQLTARYSGFLELSTLWLASTSVPLVEVVGAADISAQVLVRRGPLVPGSQSGQFQQRLTLRDVGGVVLPGPLDLVLDGLGRRIRLHPQAGVTTALPPLGSPFVLVVLPGGSLSPGQRVKVLLHFTVPPGGHLHYTPRVLISAGAP
jgi:hypothetical protein